MTQTTISARNTVARTGFANPLTLAVFVEDVDFLRVYADSRELTLGSDYVVYDIGDPNGVEIEIIGADNVDEYVGTETFTVLFDPVLRQGADLSLGGGLGRPFEAALDQQNLQLQAQADRIDRSLKVEPFVVGDIIIPWRPGAAIVWNDDGDGFLALPVVPAVGDTLSALKGEPGEGVPASGNTGQVLAKVSGTDYDTTWITLGTAALAATGDFATAAQGALAATAVQSTDPLYVNAVQPAAAQTLSNKRFTPRVTTIASSATPTVNTDVTDIVDITALATAITSMSSGLSGTPVLGDTLIVRIKDDGTARAITWGASFSARGAALPTATVISKQLTAAFIWGGSTWGCVGTAREE